MARSRPPKPADRPSTPRRATAQNGKPRPKTLRDISYEWPTPQQFAQWVHQEYENVDARSLVLVRVALLDQLLERALDLSFVSISRKHFDAIFRSTNAPLSPISAKIAVAHALGLFGDEFRTYLDRIRIIRNAFAHSMVPISFEHELVISECLRLDPAKLTDLPYAPDTGSIRERFTTVCDMLSNHLMNYVANATRELNAQGGRRLPLRDKFVPRLPPQSQNQD